MKQPHGLRADLSCLYTPLDRQNDEIRLITMEAPCRRGPVRCLLEKVSLKCLGPGFAAFTASSVTNGRLTRRLTSEWARSEGCSNKRGSFDIGTSYPPPLTSHRFQWGDFAALSYVWGDETKRKDILVNNVVVSVTENLEIALRHLAADGYFEDDFKLWVDALCINQTDEGERASQINKMREIYSGSWTVIAWLGLADNKTETRKAFKFLRTLAALKDDDRDLTQMSIPAGCFFSLHELMNLEYWSRLWIIQEVIMGASSTIIRCGLDIMDWDTFCRGIAVLYHGENWSLKDRLLAYDFYRKGISGDDRWKTTSVHLVHKDLRELSRFEDQGGKRVGFRRLLEIAGSAECRDIRDKVFGLVGMMDDDIAKEVTQAYTLGIPKLFATVTKAFIVRYQDLEPLRQANPWGCHGAPKWAADWTWDGRMRWTRPESSFTCPLWDPSRPEPDPATIYNAHGGISARYEFLANETLLRCDGFVLDRIAGLGAPEDGYFMWAKDRMHQCPTWKSAYGSEEETRRALLSTLMGGRVAHGGRFQDRHLALSSLPSNFHVGFPQFEQRGWKWFTTQEAYYFKWEEWRLAHNHFMLGGKRMDEYFTDWLPEEADESTYIEVYNSADRMVQERRLMLTENGYLGWAPDNAYDEADENNVRVGDLVAIIFGCSTPLVVRAKGEFYEIVGEAYVEGFMDGEGVRLVEGGERKVESFTFV